VVGFARQKTLAGVMPMLSWIHVKSNVLPLGPANTNAPLGA